MATPSARHYRRGLPKLYPREVYMQRVAQIYENAKTGNWGIAFRGRQLYYARRAAWREQIRLRNPTQWITSWDNQVKGLMRKGLKPHEVSDLMVVQAYQRQFGSGRRHA
jgi:hypothetical protein